MKSSLFSAPTSLRINLKHIELCTMSISALNLVKRTQFGFFATLLLPAHRESNRESQKKTKKKKLCHSTIFKVLLLTCFKYKWKHSCVRFCANTFQKLLFFSFWVEEHNTESRFFKTESWWIMLLSFPSFTFQYGSLLCCFPRLLN